VSTVSEARATRALPLAWRKDIVGELWAEFFGCVILISFGDGVVAMLWALVGSGRSSTGALRSSGDWLLITCGSALAVASAVYSVGGITSAHIKPAISLGAAIRGQLPWRKAPGYWTAQVLGCFVGAALVFLVYNNAINHFDQVNHIVKGTPASVATYSTFATFPAPYFHSVLGPLIDQIVGTFFLALFVWAVTDQFNLPVGSNLGPFIIGTASWPSVCRLAPMRVTRSTQRVTSAPGSLPRSQVGGKVAMPGDYVNISAYFWVPIVGPLIGAALASWPYDFAIRDILKARRRPAPGIEAEGRTVQRDIPPDA
jgi:glycerol uptake facilitator protein